MWLICCMFFPRLFLYPCTSIWVCIHLFPLFMYACLHICLCVHVRVHWYACVCTGRPEVDVECHLQLLSSLSYFVWGRVSHGTGSSLIQPDLVDSQPQESSLALRGMHHPAWLFTWMSRPTGILPHIPLHSKCLTKHLPIPCSSNGSAEKWDSAISQ